MTAKFITLEGMDGAGKSTHIPTIIRSFKARGLEVVSTREPGGTALGERLRELLLHEIMHPETETLLMFAARREHIANVIAPALARGAYVLSDRFTDATYAYQCGAKGVLASKIELLEQWVHGDLQPDLTLLFDVPVEVSLQRLSTARAPDKFERESADFFTRIRNAYLQRARENPTRFRVIDANRPLDEVYKSVEDIIATL
ncbi:MAG: dTMP kinase [Methylotenera sp.]|nr:dTMP kinase [Methylotenera sp.]MDO9232287.1 dTMP kinase [Methylotenera sp.]MDO9388111.1 dTMP kinase [Methylotenera sp.]MDP2102184.1 dTMP kinase [Methylotenera sp.]MDP2281144.1 dTMP kinase [Methylotenera sp.]